MQIRRVLGYAQYRKLLQALICKCSFDSPDAASYVLVDTLRTMTREKSQKSRSLSLLFLEMAAGPIPLRCEN